jgi:hypothetical protein
MAGSCGPRARRRRARPLAASMTSSESIQKIQRPRAWRSDSLRAAEKLSHQGKRNRRAPRAAAIFGVSSLEPVSTTMISSTQGRMLSRQARMVRALSRTMMQTDSSIWLRTRSRPPPRAGWRENLAGCRSRVARPESSKGVEEWALPGTLPTPFEDSGRATPRCHLSRVVKLYSAHALLLSRYVRIFTRWTSRCEKRAVAGKPSCRNVRLRERAWFTSETERSTGAQSWPLSRK